MMHILLCIILYLKKQNIDTLKREDIMNEIGLNFYRI